MRHIIPLFLLFLLLPSCSPSDSFDAGQPLTRDELASLSAELFTQPPVPETESVTEGETRDPNLVYWTEGGSVYHLDPDCHHLKKSKSVEQGSVPDAKESGKEKVCSSCGED